MSLVWKWSYEAREAERHLSQVTKVVSGVQDSHSVLNAQASSTCPTTLPHKISD